MTAKLTRLTHKRVIQLHLVAESCTLQFLLQAASQSGNFWVHPHITHCYVMWCSPRCV